MDFVKTRKKRRFKDTLRDITLMLNQEREVSVKRLVEKFGYVPDYCRKLLRWTAEMLPYAQFDEEAGILLVMMAREFSSEVHTEEVLE